MSPGLHEALIDLIETLTTVEQVTKAMNLARKIDEYSQDSIWKACEQAMARVQSKPPTK